MSKRREYTLQFATGPVEVVFDDDQMKSLVDQFKNHIAMETGRTDRAVVTNTSSVDDAHDDQGNTGFPRNQPK